MEPNSFSGAGYTSGGRERGAQRGQVSRAEAGSTNNVSAVASFLGPRRIVSCAHWETESSGRWARWDSLTLSDKETAPPQLSIPSAESSGLSSPPSKVQTLPKQHLRARGLRKVGRRAGMGCFLRFFWTGCQTSACQHLLLLSRYRQARSWDFSWFALKENYWLVFLLSGTETLFSPFCYICLFSGVYGGFWLIFSFARGAFKFAHMKNKHLFTSAFLPFSCSLALPVQMHWPLSLGSYFCLTIIFSQNSRDTTPLLSRVWCRFLWRSLKPGWFFVLLGLLILLFRGGFSSCLSWVPSLCLKFESVSTPSLNVGLLWLILPCIWWAFSIWKSNSFCSSRKFLFV